MIQIAGPNGSGKTTLYKSLLEPALNQFSTDYEYINADDIEKEMREGGCNAPPGLDLSLSIAAQAEANYRREQLLESANPKSFVFETVFSDSEGFRLDFMRRAKNAGYCIVLIFIAVDNVGISAERVKHRVEQGGHDVPLETQIKRYPNVLENGRKAIAIAHLSIFMDNSVNVKAGDLGHTGVALFVDGKPHTIEKLTPQWFSTCWP